MKSHIRFTSGAAAMLLAGALPVAASTVDYNFGQVSSGTAPAGSPPWLQAVFTDNGMPSDTVQMTLSAGNLTGNEFVSCWYFNLNPTLIPGDLSFSVSSSTGSFTAPTVQTGANSFKAGTDGKFDVLLGFNTGSDASAHFSGGDSITFTITGISGLTANDFDFLSTPAGGSGLYSSAAHVQGIDDGGSGWINPASTQLFEGNDDPQRQVPDGGTTVGLLGASLLAIEGFRRMIRTPHSAS